jgi:hypothetical protein
MVGNLHIGLAALGAAIAVGVIGMKASGGGGTQSGFVHKGDGAVDSGHRLRRGDRVLHALPRTVTGAPMLALLLQQPHEDVGQIQQIARTFGVAWPHLIAQILSFSIVCALRLLARVSTHPPDARTAASADR